jgi:hypothetical protein
MLHRNQSKVTIWKTTQCYELSESKTRQEISKGKGKGKAIPVTGHEGP